MNARAKTLLGAMLLVGLVMLGDQWGLLAFLDNTKQQSALAKVVKQIQVAEDLVMQGADATEKLRSLETRSLPYDSELARSLYQDWLSGLVKKNQLSQSIVEVALPASVPLAGTKKEAYLRYSFTVNGSGTLEQVTKFLFDFYQGGHLQRINNVRLSPASGSLFTLGVAGEAISLATCDREATLSTVPADRLEFATFAPYQGIVRRNIFSQEAGATLKLVRLSSVTYDKQGLPEAWFKVGTQQATRKLQRGEHFTVSAHRIEVIDIQPKSALLDVDGVVVLLPIGKTIHEVQIAEVAAR